MTTTTSRDDARLVRANIRRLQRLVGDQDADSVRHAIQQELLACAVLLTKTNGPKVAYDSFDACAQLLVSNRDEFVNFEID